jgi:hypothetical protein
VAGPSGIGSAFATTIDTIEKKPGEGKAKRQRGKNLQGQGKEDVPFGDNSSAKLEGFTWKKPKCFSCSGEHCINNCLAFLEFKMMKEKKQAAVTWEATTFAAYQFNAIGAVHFKPTEVLQDNQANTSIMRPDLLLGFEMDDTEVRIYGVGGVQLCTNETGYLPNFF